MTTRYLCDDGNAEVEIEAESPRAAAEQYVADGDWGQIEETIWLRVYVVDTETDERRCITIALDPDEPDCAEGECDGDHDWQAPHEVVGGIAQNPGVWVHGGGAIIRTCCIRCGCGRVEDTWASNPETGEQGLRSVEYTPRQYDVAEEEETR